MVPGPEARRVRLRCRLVAQSGRPSVLCTLVRASGSAPLGSCSVVRCASLWLVVTRWYREAGAQRSICRRAPERPSRYAAVWPSTANSIDGSPALIGSCAEATRALAASIVNHIAPMERGELVPAASGNNGPRIAFRDGGYRKRRDAARDEGDLSAGPLGLSIRTLH